MYCFTSYNLSTILYLYDCKKKGMSRQIEKSNQIYRCQFVIPSINRIFEMFSGRCLRARVIPLINMFFLVFWPGVYERAPDRYPRFTAPRSSAVSHEEKGGRGVSHQATRSLRLADRALPAGRGHQGKAGVQGKRWQKMSDKGCTGEWEGRGGVRVKSEEWGWRVRSEGEEWGMRVKSEELGWRVRSEG